MQNLIWAVLVFPDATRRRFSLSRSGTLGIFLKASFRIWLGWLNNHSIRSMF